MNCDPNALAILHRLRAAGHEAYLVGGCVRDHLMNLQPDDWDIATSACPDAVEALFERTVPVGKSFGVILVVLDEHEYQVATFRGDGTYTDGRRPDHVAFTDAEEDVKRRDFTINALLYDPDADRVLDFVGGQQDIYSRVLRTVGDPRQRFREDHLRLLRAVRFAARTGFTIEPATLAAMRELRDLVKTVSGERVGQELVRMFSEGSAGPALRLLEASGLLDSALPEVARMRGVPQPPEYHPEGDVLTHTLLMLDGLDATLKTATDSAASDDRPVVAALRTDEDAPEILAWAVLLHDVGKPVTITYEDRIRFDCHDGRGAEIARDLLGRLRRPARIIDAVGTLIGRHMKFSHIRDMREAKRRRLVQAPLFPLDLELHRLDCDGSHRLFDHYEFATAAWFEEKARPPVAKPLLSGHDLIALGFSPGPRLGEILRAVDDLHLENILQDRAAALAWVGEHYPPAKPGVSP
ncbi:MAG: hypothetical protein A3K18_30235 [Lentisphaerae bacterium RIFOXYA12_64_32]|nr:MAG: hypothetical protein A3K18_30235 [Lentisphaerae bacterium RIFOXYA12_64_32]